jgi:hypothetical protein
MLELVVLVVCFCAVQCLVSPSGSSNSHSAFEHEEFEGKRVERYGYTGCDK